jgi:hypothetical protein
MDDFNVIKIYNLLFITNRLQLMYYKNVRHNGETSAEAMDFVDALARRFFEEEPDYRTRSNKPLIIASHGIVDTCMVAAGIQPPHNPNRIILPTWDQLRQYVSKELPNGKGNSRELLHRQVPFDDFGILFGGPEDEMRDRLKQQEIEDIRILERSLERTALPPHTTKKLGNHVGVMAEVSVRRAVSFGAGKDELTMISPPHHECGNRDPKRHYDLSHTRLGTDGGDSVLVHPVPDTTFLQIKSGNKTRSYDPRICALYANLLFGHVTTPNDELTPEDRFPVTIQLVESHSKGLPPDHPDNKILHQARKRVLGAIREHRINYAELLAQQVAA